MRPRLLLFVLLASAACSHGEADAPRWVKLARGFTPADAEGGFRMATEIPASLWERDGELPGQWWVPRPETGGYRNLAGEEVVLRLGETELRQIRPHERRDVEIETGDGLFYLLDDRLVVRPRWGRPTEVASFESVLDRGRSENGVWRAPVRNAVGDGLSVWPGEEVELQARVPGNSTLRFLTVAHALGESAALAFRVTIDGSQSYVYQTDVEPGTAEEVAHEVALPFGRAADARLGFEVVGDPALTAFLDPVVGPTEIGTYGARPWKDARPDVVVFLADTFRADNLAAYGGDPELAPHLNALAERSLRFLRARSTSVWTLPSHGSLFTGVLPPQHGAVTPEVTFARELETIAEHLAAQGYRTGAVTDSAYVSRQYGMDQGFEWFTENEFADQSLARTLAEADAFLDRDDGRPVFLFVHTYRVHHPYRQGAEESTQAQEELMQRIAEALRTRRGEATTLEILLEFVDEYRALYLDGVRALDAQLGPWLATLGERGLLEHGLFVFTSDHGEEFYEHGNRGHKGLPYEEKVRIPLLLSGGGVAPGETTLGASLIDLAPTLAAFCGAPRLPVWEGVSLLGLDHERLLFTHNAEGSEAYLSATDRDRKLIAVADAQRLEQGEFLAAYELDTDPGEKENAAADAGWAADLARALAPLWRERSVPLGEATTIEMSEAMREQLRKLGYGE